MAQTYTLDDVAKHNTEQDCWIVVKGQVMNVTHFLGDHPGGKKIILRVAGKDATAEFNKFHAPSVLAKYAKLKVGEVGSGSAPTSSSSSTSTTVSKVTGPALFGEMVPLGDPTWYQGYHSPYYNDSHKKWRAAIRQFVDTELTPYCHEWDEQKKVPTALWRKCYEAGWLPAVVGPPWPVEYCGSNLAGGIKPDEFDPFHELILQDEVCRCGSGGVVAALFAGLSIGLPPVLHFGSKYLKDMVAGPCLRGEKLICLAITEPQAGSDVANLVTEAKLTADGQHYIVNGEKKWITNGVFSDFFTVAVRTGGNGMGGISLLLMSKDMPGLKTRQMQCMGLWPSGTTYVTFEDVKVPVSHLIGEENKGFLYIMHNFNHERYGIICQAVRFSRVLLEESIKYAHKRKTFGKKLVDHPVIRQKLALMAAKVEALQGYLENVTYQMCKMGRKEANVKLGGQIALLKALASQTMEYNAREAAQIFGGLGYTRGGQGEKVERLYREVRAYAIPGGSEEIMLDLGIRQSLRIPGAKL